MSCRKTKKKHAVGKQCYVYWDHTIPQDSWKERTYGNKIKICAIDPAYKNFGIGIGNFFADGTFQIQYLDNWHLEDELDSDQPIDQIFIHISNRLRQILYHIRECDFVLIEKQLNSNTDAIYMIRHVLAFLMLELRDLPSYPFILHMAPHIKGKFFGAPKNINQKGLKDWSKEKAYELCYAQEDFYACQIILREIEAGKGDDVGDVILMMVAFFLKEKLGARISEEVEIPTFSLAL
jgi:hypothetical protein